MTLRKGENIPLPTTAVRLEFERRAEPGTPATDVCALLLGADGTALGGGALVHRAAPRHSGGAVRYDGAAVRAGTAVDALAADLAALPAGAERVVLFARGDGGAFRDVREMRVRVLAAPAAAGGPGGPGGPGGEEIARFDCGEAGAETAYVLGECYRRGGGWRFRAIGQGYEAGLPALAAAYGLGADELPPPARPSAPAAPGPAPAPEPRSAQPPPAPAPASAPAPVALTKVTLTKAAPAVSLAKQGGTSGALRVSLNWQSAKRRWGGAQVDLDLCALFELTDGSKGVVQALGRAFGSYHRPPFLLLDGDDRAGGSGENMTLNLDHAERFRRVLFFVTIYQGARSFAGLHATVTLHPQHGAPIDFALDECTDASTVCALALLVREGPDLVVRREARYLVPRRGISPQRTVDYAYGWGLTWRPGRK
jgi:tellurite resistance protein TerA